MSSAQPISDADSKSLSLALAYYRVSTSEQANTSFDDEGFSIQAQRDYCRRKAAELKARIADEFIDKGKSARTADRPDLQRLLKRVKEDPDIRYVIVHKIDRLARSREDDVQLGLLFARHGVRLVSATENIDETPSGKLVHGIMATIAEWYSGNLSEEAKKGMRKKAEAGGLPGKAPLGYVNERAKIPGKDIGIVVVDPVAGPIVTHCFRAYATGLYTISGLTDEANELGLRLPATKSQPERPRTRSRCTGSCTIGSTSAWLRGKGWSTPERTRRSSMKQRSNDALTLDEFKLEQERIGREVRSANEAISRWTVEVEALTRALDEVLSLLVDPHRLYTEAPEGIALMLAQAVCEKIWMLDTGVVGVDLTAPMAEVLTLEAQLALAEASAFGETPTATDREGVTYYRHARGLAGLRAHHDQPWPRPAVERPNGPLEHENPASTRQGLNVLLLAGVPGLEPRLTEPESVGLPITLYPKVTQLEAAKRPSVPRRCSVSNPRP